MQLITTGVSYKTAPLGVREQLSFNETEIVEALPRLMTRAGILEGLILSTCNRFEIYALVNELEEGQQAIFRFVEQEKHAASYTEHCYTYYNKTAVQHLYRVAAGLESMVIGEGEILGQVKRSMATGMACGASGTVLNSLFKHAVEAGKRVRTETGIAQRSVSIGSVAVDHARQVFASLEDRTVLLLGAGKISEATARNLQAQGVQRILVANRSFEKASELAQKFDGEAIPFDDALAGVDGVDIVIACTAAKHYVVGPQNVSGRRHPLLLIDLAVPRNIDPAVEKLPHVQLCNLDDLHAVVKANQAYREQFISRAEEIVANETSRFQDWFKALGVTPLIGRLYDHADAIRFAEIAKIGGRQQLSESELAMLEQVTRAITRKLLHQPVVTLKGETDAHQRNLYAAALTALFGLDDPATETVVDLLHV